MTFLVAWVPKFIKWLGRFVQDGKTGNPSIKRLGFAIALTVLCVIMAFLGGVIVAMTYKSDISTLVQLVRICADALTFIAATVAAMVTTGYIGGKMAEKKPEAKADVQP